MLDSGSIIKQPPFTFCHAATIVETGKDTLLYAWFGGDFEGAKNAKIWGCYRYPQQKKQWGELQLLASGRDSNGAQACWNPVLFRTKNNILFLDFKVGKNPREWWAERKTSYDGGRTWSKAQQLKPPFLGPIKNKPIQLKNGQILYPSSTESTDEKTWSAHIERSNSDGDNWEFFTLNTDSFQVIQPCFLTYGDDFIQQLCRSKSGHIMQSWSKDNGQTWSDMTATELPNPNSGIDAVSLKNGYQVLVYNPLPPGQDWWVGRSVLKVAISWNGNDWKDIMTLENRKEGEFSYPAIIEDGRGIIRIAYTDQRKNIRFVDVLMK